jgi:hypothetical protein
MKPIWNVFVANFKDDRPESFNIFDHYSFSEGCNKAFAECKHDKATFAEEVKHELMYYYWSKYEWEIIIKKFGSKERKIDLYEQVMLNWDKFIDYLWDWYTHTVRYYSEEKGISDALYISDD